MFFESLCFFIQGNICKSGREKPGPFFNALGGGEKAGSLVTLSLLKTLAMIFWKGKDPITTHGDPVLKNSCQQDIPEKVSESNKWKQGESDERHWNKWILTCVICYDFKKLAIFTDENNCPLWGEKRQMLEVGETLGSFGWKISNAWQIKKHRELREKNRSCLKC